MPVKDLQATRPGVRCTGRDTGAFDKVKKIQDARLRDRSAFLSSVQTAMEVLAVARMLLRRESERWT